MVLPGPGRGYAPFGRNSSISPPLALADPKAAARRETVRLEEFRQSPQGFWYPRVIHDTAPVRSAANRKAGREDRPLNDTVTVRDYFDFSVALPDWLFVMDDASKSRK